MRLVIYRTSLGLWLNWFRYQGRLFIVLHFGVWALVAFHAKGE